MLDVCGRGLWLSLTNSAVVIFVIVITAIVHFTRISLKIVFVTETWPVGRLSGVFELVFGRTYPCMSVIVRVRLCVNAYVFAERSWQWWPRGWDDVNNLTPFGGFAWTVDLTWWHTWFTVDWNSRQKTTPRTSLLGSLKVVLFFRLNNKVWNRWTVDDQWSANCWPEYRGSKCLYGMIAVLGFFVQHTTWSGALYIVTTIILIL